MRECFVHPFDRRCLDIAAFWHRLTQNYNGRNLVNAARPPNRIEGVVALHSRSDAIICHNSLGAHCNVLHNVPIFYSLQIVLARS
jgi:hypothetical protein